MASKPSTRTALRDAVEVAARNMIAVQHWGDASFVSLPLFGPDGSPVTVRVTQDMAGIRVDDGGMTFRELDRYGMGRSFFANAGRIAAREDLSVTDKLITTFADEGNLERAISDVAAASWGILDRVYRRTDEASESELEEHLRERLSHIFGDRLDEKQKIGGASATMWSVSAIVRVDKQLAIFQAVSDHANSVYKASAAFHDLASLPQAPKLVAVVRSKDELGNKLGILAQIARVIEEGQSEDTFKRAVA